MDARKHHHHYCDCDCACNDTPDQGQNNGIQHELRIKALEKQVKELASKSANHEVRTIAERDRMAGLAPGDLVYVANATMDESVATGGATYMYLSNGSFHKISEDNELDRAITWAKLEDKPKSSVEDIDKTVDESHVHKNISCLAKLGGDGKGNLTYGGKRVYDGKQWVVTINKGDPVPDDLAKGGLVLEKDPETGEITIGQVGEDGTVSELPTDTKPEDIKLPDGSDLASKMEEIATKLNELQEAQDNPRTDDIKLPDGKNLTDALDEIALKYRELGDKVGDIESNFGPDGPKKSVMYTDKLPATTPPDLVDGGLIIVMGA